MCLRWETIQRKFTEYNQEINKINNLKIKIDEKNSVFWNTEQGKLKGIVPEWLNFKTVDNDKEYIKSIDIGELSGKIRVQTSKLIRIEPGIFPNRDSFSSLLRRMMSHIVFVSDLKKKLEYVKDRRR